MKAYHYSLLRYRHNKAAGEFANIGVLMLVEGGPEVFWFVTQRYQRLANFFADFDADGYRTMVGELREQFDALLSETSRWGAKAQDLEAKDGELGPIGASVLNELMQMLVPEDEACFQWSGVMSGAHPRPDGRFGELCQEFIVRHEENARRAEGASYLGLSESDLEGVAPDDVRRYLLARGWRMVSNPPDGITLFRPVDESQEVVLPTMPRVSEPFFRRLAEAIYDVAQYEGRSIADVLDGVLTVPDD
jgi:hypothetical protein